MNLKDEHDWPEDLSAEEPAPDAEELALARRLGAVTDQLLAGELPRSVDTASDPLLAAATMLRSAAGVEEHLGGERGGQLIQRALHEAAARPVHRRRRPRGRALLRAAPYLALAASVVLLLSAAWIGLVPARRSAPPAPAARPVLLSRPSNDLMGQPFSNRAGASERLDLVFADRLQGYRQLTLLAARSDTTVTP